jgi:16S rRNA (cytidine1402-2'-O)-methyltransferase
MKGTLYIVSTPIGNLDDITLRALDRLKNADMIVCEEYKIARRLLSNYKIDKELISLNEHNESESAEEVLKFLKEGKSAALISDCGTPLFSDPGHLLLDLCITNDIKIEVVPGVNSLIPAITGSGLKVEKFYYAGWLSPKKDIRRKELLKLKSVNEVIALLETPYRLKTVLKDIKKVLGNNIKAVLAFEITSKNEKFYRATLGEIYNAAERLNLKGEFVLLIDNRKRNR